MKNLIGTLALSLLASHVALAAATDLPLYESGDAQVKSVNLINRLGNVNEVPRTDLVAIVRVVTGCQPTSALIKETQVTLSSMNIRLQGAGLADKSGLPHCFAIGYRDEAVTLASYAIGQTPSNIQVNGIAATAAEGYDAPDSTLPLFDAYRAQVKSAKLVPGKNGLEDLVATVTVAGGCEPTNALDMETEGSRDKLDITLFAARKTEQTGLFHCFMITHRDVEVTLGSYAPGVFTGGFQVNGIQVQ